MDIMTITFPGKERRPCLAGCSQQQAQGRPTQLIIILTEYELVENPSQIFFVRSLEPFFCPRCHSDQRIVIGSRNRILIRTTGIKIKLRIRRLRCKSCKTIHHELPSEVIPYKRHEAESIEAVLEERELLDTPADELTLKRWRAWFAGLAGHLLGALMSAARRSNVKINMAPFAGCALRRIRRAVGDAPGWLSRIVQTAVKNNCWVQTRSAFHAGKP